MRFSYLLVFATISVLLSLTDMTAAGNRGGDNRRADENMESQQLDFIPLRQHDNHTVAIRGVMLRTNDYICAMPTSRGVLRHNEDRIGIISKIPIVGELFQGTYDSGDFTADKRVGTAYLNQSSLYIDLTGHAVLSGTSGSDYPDQIAGQIAGITEAGGSSLPSLAISGLGEDADIAGVVVYNEKYSYNMLIQNFTCDKLNQVPSLSKVPAMGNQIRQSGVYYKKNKLVVFVTPNIISYGERE